MTDDSPISFPLDDRDRLLEEIEERYQDFRAGEGDIAQGPVHNNRGGRRWQQTLNWRK